MKDETRKLLEGTEPGECDACGASGDVKPSGLRNKPLCARCAAGYELALDAVQMKRAEGCRFVAVKGTDTGWIESSATLRQAEDLCRAMGAELIDTGTPLGVEAVIAAIVRIQIEATGG